MAEELDDVADAAGNIGNINDAAYAPDKKPAVRYRVHDGAGTAVLIFAVFFDLLSVIPGVNDVIVFISQTFFFVIFTFFLGVPVVGKKTWIWYFAAWVIELIPFISILPATTLMVFRFIAISRIEDRLTAEGIGRRLVQSQRAAQFARNAMQSMEKRFQGQKVPDRKNTPDSEKGKREEERQGRLKNARTNLDKSLEEAEGKKGAKERGELERGPKPEKMNYLTGRDAGGLEKAATALAPKRRMPDELPRNQQFDGINADE
jgi:hypothetical protein